MFISSGFNPMSPMMGGGCGGCGGMAPVMGGGMPGFGGMPSFGGMSPMGEMSPMGGMDMMMLQMQQQFLSSMMGMLGSLFQGGFGGGANAAGGLPAMANFGGPQGGGGGLGNFLGGGGAGRVKRKKRKKVRGGGVSGGGGGGGVSGGGRPTASASPVSNVGGSSSAAPIGANGNVAGWGKKLAEYAGSHATGSGGYCYRYVKAALAKFGVNVEGASAYMAADQLAKSGKFREVKVEPSKLKSLPAGAVVVWNRGNGHEHGHISVALGNGREASDVPRTQITSYGTSCRVFLPK